jgi:hypothetical protein
VRLTLLVTDRDEGLRRYPFETATIENIGGDWRQVLIPLATKSTGFGDEDRTGAPKGGIVSAGILVEPRYGQTARGTVQFDDVSLRDSSDQTFLLNPDAPLIPPPPNSAQLGARLGVNVHGFVDPHLLDLAREAGFASVRTDLLWRQVERNGSYRFAGYDRLLGALEARGMSALWILDYGHPQHGGDRPHSAADLEAFARYAAAAALHFRGRNTTYEIWNEPNTERFWPPAPSAKDYSLLLREAVAAIRRADPEARIVTGGLARIDLPYLEQMLEAGDVPAVHAIGVHPYRRAGPESFAADLLPLRELIRKTLGSQIDIWDTEWGYGSYDYFSGALRGDGHSTAGRHRQAVLACREILTVWALDLPGAIWYDLRDDGDDPRNPEHNYGLLDRTDASKPAMLALRQIARAAATRTFAGFVADVPDGCHAMRLDGRSDRVFVVWNDQPDASLKVRFPARRLANATNLEGEALKTGAGKDGNAEITLPETDGPVYLSFRGE